MHIYIYIYICTYTFVCANVFLDPWHHTIHIRKKHIISQMGPPIPIITVNVFYPLHHNSTHPVLSISTRFQRLQEPEYISACPLELCSWT